MSKYKEYHLPLTTDEKAQIIHITSKSNIRIDNDKIQEYLDIVISKKRLSDSTYRFFILSSILMVVYMFLFSSQIIDLTDQKFRMKIYGWFIIIIISVIFFIIANITDRRWSADELHIIPIKDYEFKDDKTKILCTTSCYSFEENDKDTKLYPVRYIQYDLKNGDVPYIDAYTYRASKYFWMTIHLP